MKPKIKYVPNAFGIGAWVCKGSHFLGVGLTPYAAYKDWVKSKIMGF